MILSCQGIVIADLYFIFKIWIIPRPKFVNMKIIFQIICTYRRMSK